MKEIPHVYAGANDDQHRQVTRKLELSTTVAVDKLYPRSIC
jgi:hypothetical protein